MASQRRRISKEERKQRDALMRVLNWVLVLVIRRLFDEGWTTEQVALEYQTIQREAGRVVGAYSTLDWNYVDETKAANEVYAAVTRGC